MYVEVFLGGQETLSLFVAGRRCYAIIHDLCGFFFIFFSYLTITNHNLLAL